MTPPCAICGRPTPDALVCQPCTDRAGRQLGEIIRLVPDARAVAAGQVRRGEGGGGGKPGSRPPLNAGATDAVWAVENALGTICRDIAETRGLRFGADGPQDRLSATLTAEPRALAHTDTPKPLEAK